MIHLKIDHKDVQVEEGTPVILAARRTGAEIPSMCWREGKDHITSCMVCMVKDAKTGKLFPSCSVTAVEGMEIITMDEEIKEARQTALELLLSEHVGDCEAPCLITCPAHMNIPLMNRYLAAGEPDKALEVVYRDIALPGVFGRICPAPCEGACHRKPVDQPVSICLLKRYAADNGHITFQNPGGNDQNTKIVSIIGAGPAGLAAAFYLRQKAYNCIVYDRNEFPGGSLYQEVESGKLPEEILKREVEVIRSIGVEFRMKKEIDKKKFQEIVKSSDAVLLASGAENESASTWGLEMGASGIAVEKGSWQISESKIFVAGSALRKAKLAIRALGQGKEAALSIDEFLKGKTGEGKSSLFNSRFGKLFPEEFQEYLKESVEVDRIEPVDSAMGFNSDDCVSEAKRCMHCDCRDKDNCLLRIYSDRYNADQKRFSGPGRKTIHKFLQHNLVVFEPAKCINCGICVNIAAEHKEEYGFSYIGRGFDIEIAVPFHKSLEDGLQKIAEEVAEACPTGALSLK